MSRFFIQVKSFFVLLFLYLGNFSFAQTNEPIILQFDSADIKQPIAISRDPQRLAEALTKNKSSDKEKFDAIFAWVASNIRYDYKAYYSSSGSSKPDTKKILKSKKGICLDYAGLMDTLCELAGITNVTVYGYAKEETFDVNDSIYVDNHAWNAVRLDGLWYVYDVTWSSGTIEYFYTTRSKRIIKWISKFKPKTKTRIVKAKVYKNDICDKTKKEYKKEEYKITWQTYRFNWLRNFLLRRSLRITSKQSNKIDTTYYLCDPKVFAITHFPDDPVWSLLPKQTMRDFETDSAFYHLDQTVYQNQNRHGYTCPKCDEIPFYDELKFHKNLKKEASAFNKNNHFVTSMCEAIIANNFISQAILKEDSLQKMITIDTSLAYINAAKSSLNKASIDVAMDLKLQQEKNRKKTGMFKETSAVSVKFVNAIVSKTNKRIKNEDKFIKKRTRTLLKYKKRSEDIVKYKADIEVKKTKQDPEKVKQLELSIKNVELRIDSLQEKIELNRNEIDELNPQLVEALQSRYRQFDTLTKPYFNKFYYRAYLLDDYKKPVVEEKKKIQAFETSYTHQLDSTLYAFADSIIHLHNKMTDWVEERNKMSKECYQLKSKQVKMGLLPIDDLLEYKSKLSISNLDDWCWVRSGHHKIEISYNLFKWLEYRQKYISTVLKFEVRAETNRFKVTSKELNRKGQKYRNIVSSNKVAVNSMEKFIKLHRSTYLKKLKEEAKLQKANQQKM